MEEIKMNVYESRELIENMLNVKGFNVKILKKSASWTTTKYLNLEFGNVKPGFSEKDIELYNNGLRGVSEYCDKRILKLPSECSDPEIYAQYASKLIKELRGVISIPYLREHYTNIAKKTFSYKLNSNIGANGKPVKFSEKDIIEINEGIRKMSIIFQSITLTL